MATVSKFANANTVVTTGFTNPTNAYADDGSYATAAPGKNLSVISDYGFAAFSTSDIPTGSTINSVTMEIQFKISTTSSVATMGLQVRNNTTLLGSQQTDATEPAGDTLLTHQVTTGVSLADLQSAGQVKARVSAIQGSSNTAVTFSVDYVKCTVDYTNSAPTVALNTPADAATGQNVNTTLNFTGTDAESNTIEYNVQVNISSGFGTADSYSESNTFGGGQNVTGTTIYGCGQSFTGDGGVLDRVQFYLKKVGSPTGNVTAKIYAHSGTYGTSSVGTGSVLATSDNVDVTTLSGSYALKTFTFSGINKITLANGTKYVVIFYNDNLSFTDYPNIALDPSSPTHDGNSVILDDGGGWTPQNATDTIFYVFSDILLDKLSTTDVGFTSGHPFSSGVAVNYAINILKESQTANNTSDSVKGGTSSDSNVAVGQTFTTTSAYNLSAVSMTLGKIGSPTDNVYVEIRSGSATGSLLGTSGNVAASSLVNGQPVLFTFATAIPLASSTKYWMLLYRTGSRDASNYILRYYQNADVYAGGDSLRLDSGTWSTLTTADGEFRTYGCLSESTTYYWRVRAIDPTGSNTYGSYATTRSFTTIAAATPGGFGGYGMSMMGCGPL